MYLAVLEDGAIAFQYDAEGLNGGFSISPFSIPLDGKFLSIIRISLKASSASFTIPFRTAGGTSRQAMLVKKGVNYERLNPLTKLSLIGGNGLGGHNYEPTQTAETRPF